jgi:hypothetical protein
MFRTQTTWKSTTRLDPNAQSCAVPSYRQAEGRAVGWLDSIFRHNR